MKPDPLAWLDTAPCKQIGPDPFFTPTGRDRYGRTTYAAAAVAACAGCEHIEPCLADALRAPRDLDEGWRAGMTAEARDKLRVALARDRG